jgi:hypothetical protein
MATLRMVCPNDAVTIKVSDEHRGKPIRCPHCEAVMYEAPEEAKTPPRSATSDPNFWSDLALFTGLGLLFLYALVWVVLKHGLGIALWP